VTYGPAYVDFLGHPEPAAADTARIRILPIPYDLTTSYQPGARRGPIALLEASTHVEWWDHQLRLEPAVLGIATLPPLEPETSGAKAMMERIAAAARDWVDPHKLLLTIGGEHSITAPVVAAHREHLPSLSVLQIDAHADLRASFEGSPHNHACVMRRIHESGVAIAQAGIRSLTAEEHQLIDAEPGITTVFAEEIIRQQRPDWIERCRAALSDDVYVTIDLDGLDPSIMPATGTPEPGGLSWDQVNQLLEAVAGKHRIVGADIVELSPIGGLVAPDFLAAKLAYRLIALAGMSRGWLSAHPSLHASS
jgi:agmatinase